MVKETGSLKNSLSDCPDYLNFINKVIEREKLKYAVPVYDLNYLEITVPSLK